ncbi:MAG: hypothetical protein Q9159_007760, partial [Coniocarpon cinnabarinum]
MHIRPLQRADLPTILPICATAFIGDELNEYLYPHRDKHPDAYRNEIFSNIRMRLVKPGTFGYVVVADSEDTSVTSANGDAPTEGEIVAVAWYLRLKDGKHFDPVRQPRSATLEPAEAEAKAARDLAENTGVLFTIERTLSMVQQKYQRRVGTLGAAAESSHFDTFFNMISQDETFEKLP